MREINLQCVAEDTKTYTFKLRRNNAPVNISGWSLYFTVKTDFNDLDSAAKISKTVIFSSNADSVNGIGYLSLTSHDTTLPIAEYFYDAKFVDTGMRETFLRGKFIIVPTIRLG